MRSLATPFRLILLPFLIVVLICAGCSSRFDPVGPDALDEASIPANDEFSAEDRGDLGFLWSLEMSQHDNYTEITGPISHQTGGTISGSVSGYQHPFTLDVPAGACQSLCNLQILVPNEGIPVYQLLPHMQFNKEVTVTLDYYKWLQSGHLTAGEDYEVFYMNEVTMEYERCSPPAVFTASSAQSTVSFKTDHFSRWKIGGTGSD